MLSRDAVLASVEVSEAPGLCGDPASEAVLHPQGDPAPGHGLTSK